MKTYNYIYLIKNQINGKIYIGQHITDDLNDGYMGSGKLLRRAFQKHGIENFTKEYLAFCDSKEMLNQLEKFYIRKYHSQDINIGYNMTSGGDGGATCPGRIPTAEERKKHSIAMKGRTLTEEHKQKIRESSKGKHYYLKQYHYRGPRGPMSEETKHKIRKANTGKHHSEEMKKLISKKVSEAMKLYYQKKKDQINQLRAGTALF